MNNRSTGTTIVFAIAAVMLLLPFAASAAEETAAEKPKPAIELGAPFVDNAILQRQMPVPVWGWSKPGTKIRVEFAGQKKTATAGKDGKWTVKLDEMKASFDPREMIITESTGKKVVLTNILVGEVWMASGQSIMQMICSGGRSRSTSGKLKIAPVGKVSPIREFEVTSAMAQLHPIEKATGAWKNGRYADYSAIAFAFAHSLYSELNVPIGILNCSFSQTAIQAWTPRQGFATGED